MVTWADQRASGQAERLRAGPGGLALHRRTGTPLHAMAPLPKLVWFQEEEPELVARVRHWVGIKDYVLWKLLVCWSPTIRWPRAPASWTFTGCNGIRRAWTLPESRQISCRNWSATTTVVPELPPETARAVQLPSETSVVVGAGDGPLANLGLGAVRPGVAACSIGTSGALRVMVEQPTVDEQGRVFCYALTDQRWVVGGAINNGGLVLEWCGDALAPELGAGREDELLRQAGTVPAGADGLIMLPYLHGERAPHWSSLPSGA